MRAIPAPGSPEEEVSKELKILKAAVREYLARPSADGHPVRQRLRRELAILVADLPPADRKE